MAVKLFLPGKRKFTLALIATGVGAALTVFLIRMGVPAKEAAQISAIVTASLWGYIGLEGGRDIVRTWKKPE
jgi:hypothetical protein